MLGNRSCNQKEMRWQPITAEPSMVNSWRWSKTFLRSRFYLNWDYFMLNQWNPLGNIPAEQSKPKQSAQPLAISGFTLCNVCTNLVTGHLNWLDTFCLALHNWTDCTIQLPKTFLSFDMITRAPTDGAGIYSLQSYFDKDKHPFLCIVVFACLKLFKWLSRNILHDIWSLTNSSWLTCVPISAWIVWALE